MHTAEHITFQSKLHFNHAQTQTLDTRAQESFIRSPEVISDKSVSALI